MKISLLSITGISESLFSVKLPHYDKSFDALRDEFSEIIKNPLEMDANRVKLLSKLVALGTEHSKAARGVWATILIEAPRYWWSQFDTYAIGRQTLSSESTMHKLGSRDLTQDDFEDIRLDYLLNLNNMRYNPDFTRSEKTLIIKRMLPESYLQTRVVQINYQSLRNIYMQRKSHRLSEWKQFCVEIENLPYSKEFITITRGKV